MTFVRGTDVRAVLTGLGVDPADALPPAHPEFSSTLGVTIIRAGDWLASRAERILAVEAPPPSAS